jgi:2-(1,2-epoxy-1,2-dihydrophenyl)acetyl-CoA isomerase
VSDGLRFEVEAGVATLTLDRPQALNALDIPLKVAMLQALRSIHEDASIRAVVLTGAGRAFCAGQDLTERDDPDAPPLDEELRDRYEPLVRAMVGLDRPIIAAINGVAAGAGASLALACDLRIAAASARFVLAFGRIGLVPDSGATWLLPRIVGSARAAELALLDSPLDAAEAERIGLVSRVVADDALPAAAAEVAQGLAAGAPLAIAATKLLLREAWTTDLDGALAAERLAQGRLGASRDHAEGLAAFRAKRPPRFTGE